MAKNDKMRAADLLGKPATVKLESVDGGKGFGKPLEVEAPAKIPGPAPVKPTSNVKGESEGARTDRQFEEAMGTPIDEKEALSESTVIDRAERIRDRIRGLKGNSAYWGSKLSYAQRQILNGALSCCEEILAEDDDNGLPKTLSRFIGVDL